MSTVYDKEKFLEMFDSMRVIEQDVDIVEYSILGECTTRLNLYISPYDEYATVMLMRKNGKSWLFDIGINRLNKIVYENETLKFYRENYFKKPALTIKIKPEISLWCRAATPLEGD